MKQPKNSQNFTQATAIAKKWHIPKIAQMHWTQKYSTAHITTNMMDFGSLLTDGIVAVVAVKKMELAPNLEI